MVVVLAVSERDQELALKNVQWWNELGGCKGHQVLFCWDQRVTTPNREAIKSELDQAFDFVHELPAPARIDGWPEGANYMWRICVSWLATRSRDIPCFLWLEPDAIPISEGWIDKLQEEYYKFKRPFMGDRVEVHNDNGEVPLHMSGVGIYQNPLYLNAGEAYRAFDIAWDMAGKDQIVPNAHFTELIEHAWKHPSFKSMDEVRSQISPKTILFHSSKDGSLIDLLRRGRTETPDLTPNLAGQAGSTPVAANVPPDWVKGDFPAPDFTCDIFIRTYPGDYQWLDYCLKSISKFCTGFRKLWIVTSGEIDSSPYHSLLLSDGSLLDVEWKKMQDETEDGYLAQQITKVYADVITDYQADYILHIDSDVVFTRPCCPSDFFQGGKLTWYYTPYSAIETPWQPITEKFMGESIPLEFMRRFPMMVPRWLYPRIREFCHKKHGVIISEYIRMQPPRAFSEFNVLGAYTYKFHMDKFHWVNTLEEATVMPFARQFYSWGGITLGVKEELDKIFSGSAFSEKSDGDKQRMAATAEEGTAPKPVQVNAGASVGRPNSGNEIPRTPPGIKELPNGVWVIEGDTHISKWIEQEGRLDHDQNSLPDILPLVKEGDAVVDAGAFVGDHTLAYSKAVGPNGTVYAFEPSPIAFQCLKHNVKALGNVAISNTGLGDKNEVVPLSGNNGNHGGAYVGDHMKLADVRLEPLDDCKLPRVDFIKIDVEGCEVKALIGMQETIRRCRPRMVIEVNEEALRRQGNTVGQLLAQLESHGYQWKVMQENCVPGDPLYDIIALPAQPLTPKVEQILKPTPKDEMIQHVAWLAGYIKGRPEWAQVMYYLRHYGVVPPAKKPAKKPKKKDEVPA